MMKKLFLLAVAAVALAACSSDDLANQENNPKTQDVPINFDVYAERTTRAGLAGGGTSGAYGVTTTTLQTGLHKNAGFGVFAYFTNNGDYDANSSTPNFMYNEQVKYTTAWTYEPVKYWPNEYGDAAQSDDLDKVSFFAYAPWVDVNPTTGTPITSGTTASAPTPPDVVPYAPAQVHITTAPYDGWSVAQWEAQRVKYGIAAFTDPAAPTDAEKQKVLDAVIGYNATAYTAYQTYLNTTLPDYRTAKLAYDIASAEQDQRINITQLTKNSATGDPMIKYVVDFKPATSVDLLWGVAADAASYTGMDGKKVLPGSCFVDLTKQNDVTGKVKWNFKHALAMLNVQICTDVDVVTPSDATTDPAIGTEGDGTVDNKTKVWLRSITFGGFASQGALNLHSEEVATVAAALPIWKDYDGSRELTFGEITLYDGLKDGKEGTTNNIQKNEKPQGLNPKLIQQDALSTGVPTTLTNLFYGEANTWNGTDVTAPIYVIPSDEQMDITVVYDIETEDSNLAGLLSDGKTHGSSIQNKIKKENIFGGTKIEAGKMYTVKIYLGIESVKFDVMVTGWVDGDEANPELPKNN